MSSRSLRSANKSSKVFWNQSFLWSWNKSINPYGFLMVGTVVIFLKTLKQISFFISLDPYQILGPTSSRLANPGEFTLAWKPFLPECFVALWNHRDFCPKSRHLSGSNMHLFPWNVQCLFLEHVNNRSGLVMRCQGWLAEDTSRNKHISTAHVHLGVDK